MQHDFDLEGARGYSPDGEPKSGAYNPADYGLPVWRDEDHMPPPEETIEAKAEPVNGSADAQNVIDDYTDRAIAIANDNRHGYSQANRWGPDYDCSSMVIQCLQDAGIPAKDRGATFTGNMREVLLGCGFKSVTPSVNLATGAGLQRGDVLLNDVKHTAIFIGNGQLVHARSSEGNSLQGDQSGNEIRVQPYYNCPWDIVLRYSPTGESASVSASGGIVQESTKEARYYDLRMPYLRRGDTGASVIAVQFQLFGQGYNIGPDGADGDFGYATEEAVKEFQLAVRLTADGIVGPATGAQLFGGTVVSQAESVQEKQETAEKKTGIMGMLKKLWGGG